jgi:hypothetical protein
LEKGQSAPPPEGFYNRAPSALFAQILVTPRILPFFPPVSTGRTPNLLQGCAGGLMLFPD